MAISFSLKQSDLKRLNKKMKALEAFPAELDAAIEHNASQAVGRMKQDAPVDTGRLRRQIHQTNQQGGLYIESEAIDPRDGRDYAHTQEYGGRYFPAQPYFFKNIRVMISKLHRDIKRRLANK